MISYLAVHRPQRTPVDIFILGLWDLIYDRDGIVPSLHRSHVGLCAEESLPSKCVPPLNRGHGSACFHLSVSEIWPNVNPYFFQMPTYSYHFPPKICVINKNRPLSSCILLLFHPIKFFDFNKGRRSLESWGECSQWLLFRPEPWVPISSWRY